MNIAGKPALKSFFSAAMLLLGVGSLLIPHESAAQEEVASLFRRYKDQEASSGYYEQFEVLPGTRKALIEIPGVRRGMFPYSPSAAQVRIRTRLADSHRGIRFYRNLRCQYCHAKETRDIHTVRANLTCRQCHGGEPIASIRYFYSPLNPIRRHAYVCAKCHEGATPSFASYVIHPPNPANVAALKTFPLLFYVFWMMVGIAVGTFAVFLPHTALWGIRELFMRKGKGERKPEHENQSV